MKIPINELENMIDQIKDDNEYEDNNYEWFGISEYEAESLRGRINMSKPVDC